MEELGERIVSHCSVVKKMQEPGYGVAKTALQMCGLTKNKGGLDGAKWIFAYICRIFVIGNAIIHFIACQLISLTTDFKKKRLEYEL